MPRCPSLIFSGMNIRSATDSDFGAIAQLFTDAIHGLAVGHYDPAQRDAWAPNPPNFDEWHRRLRSRQTLVAEDAGKLLGFISYEPNGHIDLLFTSPTATRRGVASTLYGRAEVALLASGVKRLFTEASLVSRPFFEGKGFSVEEEQNVVRRGVMLRRYAMSKTVSNS